MPTSVEGVLEPIDAVALQADWFDDAVASLRRLQADEADEALADEWEIDLEEDDDWDDDEVDIDTAELEAPAPAETLSYLPHDLAEMRQAASSPTVTDTLPYRDYEAPRMPLEIIPGGID
jgi:hypothetical protein